MCAFVCGGVGVGVLVFPNVYDMRPTVSKIIAGGSRLDSADVNSAFIDLKRWCNPAPTAALNAGPVEITQSCFTVGA